MTIRIINNLDNRETASAERIKDHLLSSEQQLSHPDITLDIVCGLLLPKREIDLLILYHDSRDHYAQLKTSKGTPIHSFVFVDRSEKPSARFNTV